MVVSLREPKPPNVIVPMKFQRTFKTTLLLFAASLLVAGSALQGQTILNPSFEEDTFTTSPGYISVNGPITGWTGEPAERVGLNTSSGPFANNGAIPDGNNVALIQGFTGGAAVLSTEITGLTPSQTYTVNFRVNARDTQSPTLRIGVDDQAIVSFIVPSVGGSNPYRYAAFDFTASAAAQTLYLTNDTGSDATALVDAFSIAPSTSGWSYANWSDDLSSGVDGLLNYTHAYSFGGSATTTDTMINGVTFKARTGTNPGQPYEYGLAGFGSQYTGTDANAITDAGGGSAALMKQFTYGGNPGTITIAGLVPGMEYVATLYSVGWEDGIRGLTFNVGDDRLTVNQDQFGNNQGIRISYHYVAPANGRITLTVTPFVAASSFHLYGFSNAEVTPQEEPVIGLQPQDLAGAIGAPATFSVTAGGVRPLSFQWQKDGVDLPGQTSRVLTLASAIAEDAGEYTVVVTNSFGAITSSVATLTFGPIPNPSFEADTFLVWPGYVNGNVPISGWVVSDPARVGINPMPGYAGPFINTGAIPDGTQAAFIQNAGSPVILGTALSGLTPGENYQLKFRANARDYNTTKPVLNVGIDDQLVGAVRLYAVGGTGPYREISLSFTPANDTVILGLTNTTVDSAIVDDFSVVPGTTQWATAEWTDDASSGVDSAHNYSHAFSFGGAGLAVDTMINGVRFLGASGVNPAVNGQFATAGFTGAYGADSNLLVNAGGGSASLGQSFIYYSGTIPADMAQSITLSNLVPGVEYLATIYGVGFDDLEGVCAHGDLHSGRRSANNQ